MLPNETRETCLPDISEWYTPDRVAAEEQIWADGRHYLENAQRIEALCRAHRLHTVIEAGCGTGWIPFCLPESLTYIAGIDRNPHMLERARAKNFGKTFLQRDLRNLMTLGAPYRCDLVCSFAVLKHFSLDDWPGVLREVLWLGRYGLFNQHALEDDRAAMDTGIEWHSCWPTRSDIYAAVDAAGHEIIGWDATHLDTLVGAPEVYITTRRRE